MKKHPWAMLHLSHKLYHPKHSNPWITYLKSFENFYHSSSFSIPNLECTQPRFSSSNRRSDLTRRPIPTLSAVRFFSVNSQPNEKPDFDYFLRKAQQNITKPNSKTTNHLVENEIPYLLASTKPAENPPSISSNSVPKKIYFESYGCQMNVNDLEIVLSILDRANYKIRVDNPEAADLILINTCAIRDNAENKIWHRLNYFKFIKKNKTNAYLKQNFSHMKHSSSSASSSSSSSSTSSSYTASSSSMDAPFSFASLPKVAVLGCMAERLKEKLIESDKLVDIVCGPDSYRDLPRLLKQVDCGQAGVNTLLSLDETYAGVSPIRISKSATSAFVSIMRGCDNMCSYCIVPFTRGRERSRPSNTIINEIQDLWDKGVREVTLLGQNVNSYCDTSADMSSATSAVSLTQIISDAESSVPSDTSSDSTFHASHALIDTSASLTTNYRAGNGLSEGFKTIYRQKEGGVRFANLLDEVSGKFPGMRFRFTSPHPKDFPDDLLRVMKERKNVCKSVHLPAQSGSDSVLERMRRGYTREAYSALANRIRRFVPNVALSSDFIAGFCGETEEDHRETLNLIQEVKYDMAYMFAYSMRERTHAHRNYDDDVADDVKQRRLKEMISIFHQTTLVRYKEQVGRVHLVLVEAPNKRNPEAEVVGRNDLNHRVVIPNQFFVKDATALDVGSGFIQQVLQRLGQVKDGLLMAEGSVKDTGLLGGLDFERGYRLGVGNFVAVLVTGCTRASLKGMPLFITNLESFGCIDHAFENRKYL